MSNLQATPEMQENSRVAEGVLTTLEYERSTASGLNANRVYIFSLNDNKSEHLASPTFPVLEMDMGCGF
jgi:hypothetical protein